MAGATGLSRGNHSYRFRKFLMRLGRGVKASGFYHSADCNPRHGNSASHSCRQSARKRRGTIRPMKRINLKHGFDQRCLERVNIIRQKIGARRSLHPARFKPRL
jgi:hypothetical protein